MMKGEFGKDFAIERFTVGTVGEPGQRTFYLQFSSREGVRTFSIEKFLVQSLIENISNILREIRAKNPLLPREKLAFDDKPLDAPIEDEFRIEKVEIFYLENTNSLSITVSQDGSEFAQSFSCEVSLPLGEQFVRRARAVIEAGRRSCPFCGSPINPEGHICPRANGYRR